METFLQVNFLMEFLIAIVILVATSVIWFHHQRKYFEACRIPYVKSNSIVGTFSDVFKGKQGFYENVLSLYNRPEVKDKPFFGMFLFHKPGIMINDPELIKKILVKYFNSFANRFSSSDVHDPLGYYNLFSVKTPLWKVLRGKLSSFFTSGKLRTMYYLLDKASADMISFIHKRLDKDGKAELEMKEMAALYSTDVIASCAYGVEANSLENPDGEFRKAGQAMFKMTFWRGLEFPAFFMLPQVMKFFRFKAFSKITTEFIQKTIPLVITAREMNGNKRNDLIDTLIEMKNSEKSLTEDMLMAQAAIFFSAGELHVTQLKSHQLILITLFSSNRF